MTGERHPPGGELDYTRPDPRWRHFIAEIDPQGDPRFVSQADLEGLAQGWSCSPTVEPAVAEMLAVARALFVQSWFRYEFQVVAVVWSLMGVEAALRGRLARVHPNEPR